MSILRVNGGALPVVTTGRDLTFYTVTSANAAVNSSAVDSDFEKLVRAIETVTTVEILGTPAAGAFRVAVSGAAPAANVSVKVGTALTLEEICNVAVTGTTVAGYTF